MLKAAKPLGLVGLHDPSFPGDSHLYWFLFVVLLILMNPSLGVLLIGAVQPFLDYFVADSDWSAAV
ncbi:hypothetical protein Gorai_003615 [Gossypium raimondii]|uniref:Uncharacterized protein n=1 Tax=Gossypium raimondii TaxID=29730 RepID=A0A7J8QQR5_GOSRA|nr:hypothetical protein [Gossypium raimondii]